MNKTIKTILFSTSTLLFVACGSATNNVDVQNSTIKSAQNSVLLKQQLQEANTCQVLTTKEEKLACYEAMEDTNTFAMLRLAIYNLKVTKDYAKSKSLLDTMIEKGNYHGYLGLAGLYFGGYGVQKDEKKAFELLQKSYKVDPNAAFRLAVFYQNGMGTKKDVQKGFDLLKYSADKGLLQSQILLSKIYHVGTDFVKKDEEKAKYWDKKIKENDNSLMNVYNF